MYASRFSRGEGVGSVTVMPAPSAPDSTQDTVQAAVAAAMRLTADVILLELQVPSGASSYLFEPGAHVDIHIPRLGIRQYSLLPSESPRLRIAVKLETDGKGGSKYLHTLRPGDKVTVGGPRNHFRFVASAPHSVFIAGGIGITPIIGMIEECVRSGLSWELHFRARSRRTAAFCSELENYGAAATCSFSDEGHRGSRGIVDIVAAAPAGAHFYCCGPERMIAEFESVTGRLDPGRVHVERFSANTEAASYGGYTVEFRRSGKTAAVQPGETILEAALRVGIDVSHSCSEGVCGACETRVLEGSPDHKDAVLSPQDKASGRLVMICCSGSLTDKLVLDL